MGFLHKLWDETLAGPAPVSGLGKLRKYDSFSFSRPPPEVDLPHVSHSITIMRSVDSEYPAGSATPSSTPRTPLSPGTPPGGQLKRFSRRKYPGEKAVECPESERLDVYTWILLISLDR